MANKEQELRQKTKLEIQKALDSGDDARANELMDFYETLPPEEYVFDQLSQNGAYVNTLKDTWLTETGEDWEGTDKELIEKEFEYWNTIENNLTLGGLETFGYFNQMSDEQKERVWSRFNVYDKTKATGKGSRPFWEQFKGVTTAILSDPTILAGGKFSQWTAQKLIPQLGTREVLRKVLTTTASSGMAGAAWSSLSDAEKQAMLIELGAQEEFSPEELGFAAGTGAVLGPTARAGTKVVGGVGRAVTHPFQATGRVLGPSEQAAGRMALGAATEEGVEAVQRQAAPTANQTLSQELSDVLGKTRAVIDNQYELLDPNRVQLRTVQGALDTWKARPGTVFPESLQRLEEKIKAGTISPEQALREIRTESQKAMDSIKAGGRGDFRQSDMQFLGQIKVGLSRSLETAGKSAEVNTRKLDRAYAILNNLGKDEMGSKILAASEDPVKAGQLMDGFFTDSKNLSKLDSFYDKLNQIEQLSGGKGISDGVRKGLREGFANRMMEDPKLLEKMAMDPRGLRLLRKMYPDDAKAFENIQLIGRKLGASKGGKELARSVIVNMTIARLGSLVGGKVGGPVGGAAGAVGGIAIVNKLLNSNRFRDAVIETYMNGGGRISTKTGNMLKKTFDLTDQQVNLVQDFLWGATAYNVGMAGAEVVRQNTGEKVNY